MIPEARHAPRRCAGAGLSRRPLDPFLGLLLRSVEVRGMKVPDGWVVLMDHQIMGLFYAVRPAQVKALTDGGRLKLVREPKNEFDPCAVRIDDHTGKKLGYVPRTHSQMVAALLDAGYRMRARISDPPVVNKHGKMLVHFALMIRAKRAASSA